MGAVTEHASSTIGEVEKSFGQDNYAKFLVTTLNYHNPCLHPAVYNMQNAYHWTLKKNKRWALLWKENTIQDEYGYLF